VACRVRLARQVHRRHHPDQDSEHPRLGPDSDRRPAHRREHHHLVDSEHRHHHHRVDSERHPDRRREHHLVDSEHRPDRRLVDSADRRPDHPDHPPVDLAEHRRQASAHRHHKVALVVRRQAWPRRWAAHRRSKGSEHRLRSKPASEARRPVDRRQATARHHPVDPVDR
jgi:hypothetical protein